MTLDPRFEKVVALMRGATSEGERAAATSKATALAALSGHSLDEALAVLNYAAPDPLVSFFAGFDDEMERQQPGWKAQRAAEQAEKERQRLERRAALIERYGTEDAVLAPCVLELRMRNALEPWRVPCNPPHERWSKRIEGYEYLLGERVSPEILAAVDQAFPLPKTFAEAKAEWDYWEQRRDDLEDVLGPDGYGDSGLDACAELRRDLLRPLVEHKLPALTIGELLQRQVYFRDLDVIEKSEILDAIIRDTEALAAQLSHPSSVSSVDTRGQIREAIFENPSRSDRDLARTFGVSPTTVGKVRRQTAYVGVPRSVQRRGQTYSMQAHQGGATMEGRA